MDTKKPIDCKVKCYYNKSKGMHYFRYRVKGEFLGYKEDENGDLILKENGKPRPLYKNIYIRKDEYVGKSFYNSQLQWHVPDENGNLSREKQAWNKKTQEELDRMLRQRQYQIDNGVIPGEEKIKVGSSSDFYGYVEKYIEEGEFKKSTVQGYRSTIKWLQKFKKSNRLQFFEIDTKFLKDFERYMQKTPFSMRGISSQVTINQRIKQVIHICHQAVDENIIDKVSFSNYKYTRASSKKKDYLSEEEIMKVAEAYTPYPEAKRWFLFSCACGLPLAESKTLKWSQINDKDDGTAELKYTRQKSAKEWRLNLNKIAREYCGERLGGDDLVFPSLRNQTITTAIGLILAQLGINKHITPHSARNTFACRFYKSTKDPLMLKKALGHESFNTTERYINRCIEESENKTPDFDY